MPVAIAMVIAMTISMTVAVAISIAMAIAVVVAMRVAVLFVFAVVVAVVVAVLSAIVAAVELFLPAFVPAPVRALVMAREWPAIAIARIKPAIVISMEAYRACEPWARSDKYAGLKPLRPIVAERGALIRLVVEVPIRARRGVANIDIDADLRTCLLRYSGE